MQTLRQKKLFSEETSTFDYLIAGFGSEPAFFGIPGIEENAFTLWSLDDAKSCMIIYVNVFRKASEEKDPETKGNAYICSRRRRIHRRGINR
jgi:NADH dehydrogenase